MDWDAIRREYTEDADSIDKAFKIHTAVMERVRRLQIPPADTLLSPRGVISALPYDLLAGVLGEVWAELMGGEPGVDLEKALRVFAADEPFPEEGHDALEELPMFLRAAVTGYLTLLREKSHVPQEAGTGAGTCPFCGTHPRMAFDSETSRELACLLCKKQGRFQRIGCPFCGNADHETLGYFDVEGVEGVRVQYCSECKHYLKVFDTRKRTVRDAETEDVLSLDLDTAAQEEGYL